MTLHKTPIYQHPDLLAALKNHRLETDTPSQLSDSFRAGWVAALTAQQTTERIIMTTIESKDINNITEFEIADLAMKHLGSYSEKDYDYANAVILAYQKNQSHEKLGKHVTQVAEISGWDKKEGEGAFNFIQRKSYEQGLEDGYAKRVRVDIIKKIEQPDNSKVICPNCVHQFRAIPCGVQSLMLEAGFEPPFISSIAEPVPDSDAQPSVSDEDFKSRLG